MTPRPISVVSPDDGSLLQNNVYKPDKEKALDALADAFLAVDAPNPLHDIKIICPDSDAPLPANKSFLAARSPFFYRTFYVCNPPQTLVTLPFSRKTMLDVTTFIHSDDSPLIAAVLTQLNKNPSAISHDHIKEISQVALAANHVQMPRLQQLAIETFIHISRSCPWLLCASLNLMCELRSSAFQICNPHDLWSIALADPTKYLGVSTSMYLGKLTNDSNPTASHAVKLNQNGRHHEGKHDHVNKSQDTPVSTVIDSVDITIGENDETESKAVEIIEIIDSDDLNVGSPPLMELTLQTLEFLLTSHIPKDARFARTEFLVLKVWAGKEVKPVKKDGEKEGSRWEHGRRLAALIDLSLCGADFLLKVVECSGLVSKDHLLSTYRSQLERVAVKSTGGGRDEDAIARELEEARKEVVLFRKRAAAAKRKARKEREEKRRARASKRKAKEELRRAMKKASKRRRSSEEGD